MPQLRLLSRRAPGDEALDLERETPPEALLISFLALLVASVASLLWPDGLREASTLVWTLAFVPPFLLSYHKGWRGAALGLAIGMAALVALELLPDLLAGRDADARLAGGITVVLISVSLGAGWLAEGLKREQRVAVRLAHYDALTGLPNRRLVELHLERRFAEAQRGGHPLSVVMFDLDDLKRLNDLRGHAVGDWALHLVAQAIVGATRRMDLSGRIGGDEFLSVLAGDLSAAAAFASRVREAIAGATGPLSGGPVTYSAGIAEFEPSLTAPDQLVAAADAAVYMAKAAGGDCARRAGDSAWRLDAGENGAARRRERAADPAADRASPAGAAGPATAIR